MAYSTQANFCQCVSSTYTGEMVWFNQAHLFHFSSFQSKVREALLSFYQENELPRNAYYGDNSPIESTVLELDISTGNGSCIVAKRYIDVRQYVICT